jgi:PKHD-type hydroxylase
MYKLIENVIDRPALAELRRIAKEAKFVDGRISNPHSKVKNNLQLHEQGLAEQVSQMLAKGLLASPEFFDFAFPKQIAPPILTRYEPGMSYGLHADAGMMQMPSGPLRSDISCTIFLTNPDEYEGGTLRISMGDAQIRFRGPPGSAILYPSTTLHEVEPVTRGFRLVGLTFIQSRIADAARRELLYELNEVAALEGNTMRPENFTRLQSVQFNLLRRWAEIP